MSAVKVEVVSFCWFSVGSIAHSYIWPDFFTLTVSVCDRYLPPCFQLRPLLQRVSPNLHSSVIPRHSDSKDSHWGSVSFECRCPNSSEGTTFHAAICISNATSNWPGWSFRKDFSITIAEKARQCCRTQSSEPKTLKIKALPAQPFKYSPLKVCSHLTWVTQGQASKEAAKAS